MLICEACSEAFSEQPHKCHNFYIHKGHCYVIPLLATCIFRKRNDLYMAGGLCILLNYSFQTHSITSVLHVSVSGHAGGLMLLLLLLQCLLDFQKRRLCQGGQHKRSDHIASAGFALQAQNKYLVSQKCLK